MSIENPEFKIEIEKPEILYHASENKNIQEFEPRAESVRDKNEGNVIFATPDVALASCFIVPSTDDWTQKSIFTLPNGESIHVLVVGDEKRFKETDKGGAIYSLPSDSFKTDLEKGMKDKEWISREPVRPTDKTEYKTGMQAMLENGVKVFFVDNKTFEKIKNSEDHGAKILQTLKPEEIKN